MDAISISVLCCAISKHLSTDYAPQGGYTENHNSIGVHVERAGPGWKPGAMLFRFDDSFDKSSLMAVGTMAYQWGQDSGLRASLGVGAGYARTSYYEGPYAAPMVELGYDRLSLQASYQYPISGADEVVAVQVKVRTPFDVKL